MLNHWWRRTPFVFAVMGLVAVTSLVVVTAHRVLADGHMAADGHEVRIREVMVGANGDSSVQFLVIEQTATGQNLWGPASTGAQSRAMLVFYDTTGREIGIYKFPSNPATGGTLRTLVATSGFAALLGAPTPDITIPALLNPTSGKVCFKSNPQVDASGFNDCVSYGSFTGDTETNTRSGLGVVAGTPAAALAILNTVSLVRTTDTGRNVDFQLTTVPTPINLTGATMSMLADSQILQGERLFMLETFGGNGRTCVTCHVPNQSFGLQPFDVQARFATVATTYDSLFVGEVSPSAFSSADPGFDYNLNVLTLTAAVSTGAPCTGELRGIITSPSSGGRAKVIARTSSTTYLVGGGIAPALGGAVTDGTCAGVVASITAGTLAVPAGAAKPGLEEPRRMRTTLADADIFPQGRALFLENVDQLTLDNTTLAVDPRVFRKSPHLLNMTTTAPFGFSGDIADLRTFSAGAVKQHYPRTLVRSSGGSAPDFRLPTTDELLALEAFQLAQEFPSGTDPNKYSLDRFATSPSAIRGRGFFFGADAKCSRCHGGNTLGQMTVAVLGQAVGTNGRLDTGVVNQTLSGGTGRDNLPCEPSLTTLGACGSRAFSVPQLFNVKHLAPYFHDASAATLRTAIAFYNSAAFNDSPAGVAIGGIHLPSQANGCAGQRQDLPCSVIPDIEAFLSSLVARQMAANSSTSQTALAGAAPSTLPSIIVRNDDGVVQQGVTVSFAVVTGTGTITTSSAVTNASGVASLSGWTLGAGLNAVTASVEGVTGSPVRFNAFGTTVASSVTASPASVAVTVNATATFTVAAGGSPAPTVAWQVSTNAGESWSTLTNTAPYSGATSTTLTITGATTSLNGAQFRAVATNAGGSATSGAAVLSVFGAGSATPATLRFSATKASASAVITSVTPAQSVLIAFDGAAGGWTLAVGQPWLRVSAASGTGNGAVTVSVADPTNVIGASTSLSGTVTMTPSRAGLAAVTIPVSLSIISTNAMPFGQVDTPAQNASGVQGAIGVTGWVLDNIGVTSVKIYRNCLSFENQASCQVVLGSNVVEIGDAAFLAGARPDVEAAFSSYPQNNRAGWGYLMLTSMLPHVTNQQSYGGQGALTLFAVTTDVEGNKTLLGRSSDPASTSFAVPTQITMANDSIAKPFGAIDTPAQGATVSGVLNNFGWALTPDSNTTAGAGDILIPTNGSTMTVFIDGLPTALVTYNQCRGSVGNPVPAGQYCNDDVANIFGNTTPQAVQTLRTSNPTLFRNLDADRAAIGSFTINTTTLTNGLHTIAWSVTDSAGRTEGIGSRFFNVLNSGADLAIGGSGGIVGNGGNADAALRAQPALARGLASSLSAMPSGDGGVWVRTGFDLMQTWADLPMNADGLRHVIIAETERLELWLGGAVDAGYLVANGTLRDLPVGASHKGAQFAWVPPAGYVGTYHLAFIRGSERIDVAVTVR
jgi:cytochrome c peroxidase